MAQPLMARLTTKNIYIMDCHLHLFSVGLLD